MKKYTVLIALLVCALLLAACGAPAKTPAAQEPSTSEDSKVREAVPQGKVDFLGGWEDSSETRAYLTVVPTQGEGDYAVQIRWNTDGEKNAEWTLNTFFNEETKILEYTNGSKFERTYGEDGSVASETQLISASSGSLRVNENGEIEWTEAQEALAASFRFKRTYCETPSAEELKENFLLPVTGIGQGSAGSSLRNATAACEIVAYAYSRDLWNANGDDLQTALRSALQTLTEEEHSAFSANYSGVTEILNASLKSLDSRIGYFEDAGVGDKFRELMQNDFARFSWATLFAHQMSLNFS